MLNFNNGGCVLIPDPFTGGMGALFKGNTIVVTTGFDAEAKFIPGGWESLGELSYFDEDGYLYPSDRLSHMTLCGGANIYPAQFKPPSRPVQASHQEQ